MSAEVKVRNYNLDALKMICAIFVVIIHTSMWGAEEIFRPIARCAVPCFFMISGFCIYNTNRTKMNAGLGRSIKHILQILLWSCSLYFFINLPHVINHNDWTFLTTKAWERLVFFNDPGMIVGNGLILWYLFAYLYVLIIVRCFLRIGILNVLKIITPFLLISCLFLGSYSFTALNLKMETYYSRNFLFTGIPFFTIGMYLKEKFHSLKDYKNISKWSCCAFIIFSIISIIERNCLSARGDIYLGTILAATALFLAFATTQKSKKTWFSTLGEKDSLYVYIFHMITAYPLFYLRKILGGWSHVVHQYCGAIIVLILTIGAIEIVRWCWNLSAYWRNKTNK